MSTPFLKQYQAIKARYPRELLFFRMGDFYELFFEDAHIAARELDITLTSRPVGKEGRIPMAGVPVKAAETYIARLLEKGYHIAICEQVGEAGSRKLMDREVVEVITPGTWMSEQAWEADRNRYVGSLFLNRDTLGLALADLTTGELLVMEGPVERVLHEMETRNVREVLVGESLPLPPLPDTLARTPVSELLFHPQRTAETLKRRFPFVHDDPTHPALRAAGALLQYLEDTKGRMLSHLQRFRWIHLEEVLWLDPKTLRNLEILEPMDPKGTSLFSLLRKTLTGMGHRHLRTLLSHPPRDRSRIEQRLQRVEWLIQHPLDRSRIQAVLRPMPDIERLLSQAARHSLTPPRLRQMADALTRLTELKQMLQTQDLFRELVEKLPDSVMEMAREILDLLAPSPPAQLHEPGVFSEGAIPELDEWIHLAGHGKELLLELERRERERTGIPNLRVGYNSVFGYYLEVTRSNLDRVPPHYIRKQTLRGSERYITQELKELEEKILQAEKKVEELTRQHYHQLLDRLVGQTSGFQQTADILAELDVLQAFSEIAEAHRYVRPTLRDDGVLIIEEGRHPIVEQTLEEPFIPNDCRMDPRSARLFILTGPNMSGKSTYLRQVALIVLLAHAGSFVPAGHAEIPLTDRIFSRVGASDNLARGVSTFMAEMLETAEILHQATPRSLVILDEVGRGTATYDGLAIAWAVAEHLYKQIRAKTLFATHFHELSQLAERYVGVKNYTVSVREWEGRIIFLRKVVPGVSSRSYGVHVAQLAGLPPPVVERARILLERWERVGKRKLHQVIQGERPLRQLFDSTVREPSTGSTDPSDHPVIRVVERYLSQRNPESLRLEEIQKFFQELKEALDHVSSYSA